MQKADTAFANASNVANTKRQQATDSKNYAGAPGAAELKQAETNLPEAIKILTEATNAKPAPDVPVDEIDDVLAQVEADHASVEEMERMLGAIPQIDLGEPLAPRLRLPGAPDSKKTVVPPPPAERTRTRR